MVHRPVRRSWVVIAAILALAVPSSSAPSLQRTDAVLAPDAEQLRLLTSLSRWLDADRDPVGRPDQALATALRAGWAKVDVVELGSYPSREGMLDHVPFGRAISETAARHGVDPLLIAAIVQAESHFDPRQVSPRGAMGLMQVMTSTVDLLDGEGDPFDPRFNLEIGTRYFRSMLERFDGDLELALAAYNAGPRTVSRYGGVPPYRETRGYVRKVLRSYHEHHRRLAAPTVAPPATTSPGRDEATARLARLERGAESSPAPRAASAPATVLGAETSASTTAR